MSGTRNRNGVKDAFDCFRTINGVKYVAWMSFPTKERIKSYRAAGIRCRRFGEELFVHPMDEENAKRIDNDID